MEINKDMTIYEVLQIAPESARVFSELGMHCVGCAIARGETVEQAAAVHGIDLELMMDKLNELLEQ